MLAYYCKKSITLLWEVCDNSAITDEYYGAAMTDLGDYGCVT
jgi:phospholipase C